MHAYQTKTLVHAGREFLVSFYADDDSDAPWDRSEGHGPVSEWTTRDKRPGERVLCADRRSRRFYDWQAACKTARAEGWNAAPYDAPNRIARAVSADFDFLKSWCDDEWHYCGVAVQACDADGDPVGDAFEHALWGLESNAGSYLDEVARDLADDLLRDEQRSTYPVTHCGI